MIEFFPILSHHSILDLYQFLQTIILERLGLDEEDRALLRQFAPFVGRSLKSDQVDDGDKELLKKILEFMRELI